MIHSHFPLLMVVRRDKIETEGGASVEAYRRLEELTLMDDYMFGTVKTRGDGSLCTPPVLGTPAVLIGSLSTQRSVPACSL